MVKVSDITFLSTLVSSTCYYGSTNVENS